MLSMLNESVEEREEKLFEGAKKIESSELSNQKEADILNSASLSVHGWQTRETTGHVREATVITTTAAHTEADNWVSISASSKYVCGNVDPSSHGLVV
jgi:hypothetical protein